MPVQPPAAPAAATAAAEPSSLSNVPSGAIPAPAAAVATPEGEPYGPSPAYFPAKALSRMPEALTDFNPAIADLAGSHVTGRMELRLWLDRDGRIDRVQLLKTELPDVFSDAALEAFRRMLFRPGEIQGVPVASWSDIVVGFEPSHPLGAAATPSLAQPRRTPSVTEN